MAFNVFPNPIKAAEEMQRTLKKDGSVFGTVFIQAPPEEVPERKSRRPDAMRKFLSVFYRSLGHIV